MMIGGAALAAAPALPGWAASRLTLGPMQIDTLSDGHLVQPVSFIIGSAPEAEAKAILKARGLGPDTLEPPCNVTLLRDGPRHVLFDLGSGPDFMPSAGKLHLALDALGVAPDDITHVVFTHAHPDHLWGLLDDFEELTFPNAKLLMGKAEFDFWRDPNTLGKMPKGREIFAVGAKRRLDLVAEQMEFFADGQEVLPGIAAQATFGHTPGHMSFEIRGGSESVMVIGDAITNDHICFEQPLWPSGPDQDPELGAKTRARLLDRLAVDKMAFIGYHLPGGGLGRAEKHGSGYRFNPEI
jgi:glyoxylase-like metal-dependent hydrolase (beta-lactamase superfamily II)